MIIKSYAAESVAAALKAVRAEMGGDAVVLNTRQTNEFGKVGVEITACIDGTSDDKMSDSVPSFDRGIIAEVEQPSEMRDESSVLPSVEESAEKTETLPTQPIISHQIAVTESPELNEQLSEIQKRLSGIENMWAVLMPSMHAVPEPLQKLQRSLMESDLPESYIQNLFRNALSEKTHLSLAVQSVKAELKSDLSHLIDDDFHVVAGDRVLFVGPPGSGKTTVMGKLAAQLVIKEKTKIKFLSLCASKVGALEELNSYGAIFDSEVTVVDNAEKLSAPTDDVATLIDTAAATLSGQPNPELLASIRKLQPSIRIVVFSSLIRTSDAMKLVNELAPYSPTHLAVTMTDLSKRWGVALTICKATGIKLALVNDAPSGVGTLNSPDSRAIMDSFLSGGGVSNE